LNKSDHEILLKFVKGLPEQLAFFVRAGNHRESANALASAKMGEAYGYRSDEKPLVAAASAPKKSTDSSYDVTQDLSNFKRTVVSELQDQINSLTQTVSKLASDLTQRPERPSNFSRNEHIFRPRNRNSQAGRTDRKLCRKCQAPGHFERACNWNEQGTIDPKVQCHICGQIGHKVPQYIKQDSGNPRDPGLAGQDPRETQP